MPESTLSFLTTRFESGQSAEAIVWQDRSHPFRWLLECYRESLGQLAEAKLRAGAVVALRADFSPRAVAVLLALIESGAIVVPIYSGTRLDLQRMYEVAEIELEVRFQEGGPVFTDLGARAEHPLYLELRRRGHPGLVLFSSGTSGDPKAAVHDFTALLAKFHRQRPTLRTLGFLLFDHIGGINTLFHTLSNLGALIAIEDRNPDRVCEAIARHRVELLPTSPTFINLLLLSQAHRRHDLSSLKLITYGTEPMAQATLARLREALPWVETRQTYGLAELGILRTKSRDGRSLWMKVGGEGYETRVVDGILQVRAQSAMLGYLNAPSPLTADGWFITGDAVEVDGEYIHVLGRDSELINVGGQKVTPSQVEGVIEAMPGVAEATVFGEPNALVGNIVCARVRLAEDADPNGFAGRLRRHCAESLERHMVPVRVAVVTEELHGERFKKSRGRS